MINPNFDSGCSIQPKYPSVNKDPRLVPISTVIHSMREEIRDIEFDEPHIDTSSRRTVLEGLEALRAAGTEYIPTF